MQRSSDCHSLNLLDFKLSSTLLHDWLAVSANTTTSHLFYATTSTFSKLMKELHSNSVYSFSNVLTIWHHNTSVNTSNFYQMNLADNDSDPPRHLNFQFHTPAPVSAIALFE
jgi:hypothetical protein